jgi:uncharacterized protein YbaR (Trm112 family)
VRGVLDPRLRELLVCPECRGALIDVPGGLVCERDAVLFPIVDGVPWMILERAKPWTVDEQNPAPPG